MSREAMKQALEALHDPWSAGPDGVANAITALRAALSESEQKPDPGAWHGWVQREVLFDNGEPIGHREPEQEPVAWSDAIIDDLQGLFDTDGITEQDSGDALIRLSDAIAAVEDEKKRYTAPPKQEPVAWANSFDLQNFDMKVRTGPDLHHTVPLYTAPPKREWVSLTDEEVWNAIDDVLEGGGWLDVARTLEQAFKEKNT